MDIRVFLGPTIPPPIRPSIEGVVYFEPARRGDIRRAMEEGATHIGLIDGEFRQNLSVSPTEIRAAAEAGVLIFGSSSMGAIRAVECPRHMTGIGTVFEWFRDGVIDGDDEVAGTYDPLTFETSAIPLVNVRFALAEFEMQGKISATQITQIVEAIAKTTYDQRTEYTVRQAMASIPDKLRNEIIQSALDGTGNIKRSDALLLLNKFTSS